ncbi:retron Ec78 anti-phage system effector ATPase PtuA [Psychromonas arctica]|uniref:retron Ec78 anti-phage system effector ATPase PtuA n=1 Tax=Psychromonas arctica TaxID=168275 RepID=UPI00041D3B64|nr:retron Ec78 anti-phage system effector ATPase PtuA [Psychromonas arctica]
MNDYEPRGIRELIRKSKAGHYTSSYQLIEIYYEGIAGIKKDLDKAQYYKELFIQQFTHYQFRLASIKLVNFKGFNDLELDFSVNNNTTVLVGNNGSGKSTILDAIQKVLTHISSRLTTRSYNGEQIDEIEINNNANFTTVTPVFSIDDRLFKMELSQSRALSTPKVKSKYTEINDLGKFLGEANSIDKKFPYPLLACYTVERANDVTTKDIENSDEILDSHIWDKSKGYSKSLSGKADFKLFFRWYKELVEADNEDNSEIKVLKAKIKSKEEEFNSPLLKELIANSKDSDTSRALVARHHEDIKKLTFELNNFSNLTTHTLEFVSKAIYIFLPGFSNLKVQRKPLDLTIRKNNKELSVLQLSQGEKSILALVADIARRLTLLNPASDNPLSGTGIVAIDEIDLHLHPSWQQKIISRLESTFENLQFIVTTHSPQVCHTIDSEYIWLLKEGRKYRAPKGVRGGVSSWVLKNLFEVEERPPEDKFTQLLSEYKKLVYENEYSSERAVSIRQRLKEHFGHDYDYLVELDMYIENREWEKTFDQN